MVSKFACQCLLSLKVVHVNVTLLVFFVHHHNLLLNFVLVPPVYTLLVAFLDYATPFSIHDHFSKLVFDALCIGNIPSLGSIDQ